MMDGSGQDQRELEQIHSINEGYGINEGYFISSSSCFADWYSFKGFSKVRITTINTKIPNSVPTGTSEPNIFIGHSLAGFKNLQGSYWEEKTSMSLQEPSDCPETSQ